MSPSRLIVRAEVRILGIDTCNPNSIIAAVLRGGQYLDGVLTLSVGMGARQAALKINGTKYRPELRAIMIHDPRMVLDSSIVQRMTNLLVLDWIGSENGRLPKRSGQTLGRKASDTVLSRLTIDKMLAITRTKGRMPEPVRIAHLLAKMRVIGRFSQDKR